MPLLEWPPLDRAAWDAAQLGGGLLDEHGLAAEWRPLTKRSVVSAYGRYLTFVEMNGWLDRNAGPAERINLEWVRDYVAMLTDQVAPATVAGRIRGLAEAIRVMVPGVKVPYLNRARQRLKQRAVPSRNKRARIVPIQKLFQLGLKLIKDAETGKFSRAVWRASTYRDGLILLLLSCRPLRAANLAGLLLGEHLTKRGDVYHLALSDDETKGKHHYDTALHPLITRFIDRYLEHYRPILLEGLLDDGVWISWGPRRMNYRVLYGITVTRTTRAFGRSINPHLFRDCAVTSLGEENPSLVWVGMQLLGHRDPRTTEKHYDQALSTHAVRQYQDSVRAMRKKARRPPLAPAE
jgi:integrase